MLKRRLNRVMPPPASCPLTVCLHYLRGAWTANVLWYLSRQPRRFTELKSDLAGVSSKVLTQCLRRLERDRLVQRNTLRTSPPSVEYALTELGRELQPALAALVAVGHKIKLGRRADDRDRAAA
jgi:DNA-binding HxlR family transcriptional regulator